MAASPGYHTYLPESAPHPGTAAGRQGQALHPGVKPHEIYGRSYIHALCSSVKRQSNALRSRRALLAWSLASAERCQGRRSRPVGTFRTAQLRLQTPQASGLSLLQNTEGVAARDAVTASPRRKRRKGQYDADTVLLRVLLKREATGNRGSRLAPSASGLRGLSRPDRKGDGKTAAPATFRSVLPPHAFEWTCSCRPHGALRKGHNVAAPCT